MKARKQGRPARPAAGDADGPEPPPLPDAQQRIINRYMGQHAVLFAGLVPTCRLARCRRAKKCLGPADGYPESFCDWPCITGPDCHARHRQALGRAEEVIAMMKRDPAKRREVWQLVAADDLARAEQRGG